MLNVAGIIIFLVIVVCDIWVLGWSFSHQGELTEFQIILMLAFVLAVTAGLLAVFLMNLGKTLETAALAKENNRLLRDLNNRSSSYSSDSGSKKDTRPDEVIWKR